MKIERTSEPLCLWKSLLFSFILSLTFFGAWVLLMVLLCANSSHSSILFFVGFMLVCNFIIFIVLLLGHFFYYNFNLDVRHKCVICHEYVYESTMNELKDDDTLESVHICKTHKWVY